MKLAMRRPAGKLESFEQLPSKAPVEGALWFKTGVMNAIETMDVIKENKVESDMQSTEQTFQALFDAIPESIFLMDRQGIVLRANELFAARFGRRLAECLGRSIYDLLSFDAAVHRRKMVAEVLRTGKKLSFEGEQEGDSLLLERKIHHICPLFGLDGEVNQLVVFLQDIIEFKGHEALMEFRLRLLTLPDSCSIKEVLQTTVDEAERLTESGVGFFHILDIDQMTLPWQVWSTNTEKKLCRVEGFRNHYPIKDAGAWADVVRERRVLIHNAYEALPHGKGMPEGYPSIQRELVVPVMRGDKITAIIGVGNKFSDYNQEDAKLLLAMAGIAWDIIGRKQAELSERRIQNELAKAQKMELVGRMAGGIAHDFNNMLCVILGHAEMALLDSSISQSVTESLQEIYNAAEKSADLANQLLAFARKQPLNAKVLDLNMLVGDMLNMLRRLLGKNITLVWNPGQNLYPVTMDSSHFDQIIVNLCVNARDAIAGLGVIVIETKNITLHDFAALDDTAILAGEYVLLSVSDNGCGIGEQDAGHIFEPFFTTKESGKGTGLGLSTVYGLVKQNNGLINFSSEPGKGTEFSVYLPKYSGSEVLVKREQQAEQIKTGGETILIVDDEEEILKLSKMMLQKQGYRVLTAGSPGKAIKIAEAREEEIHLLLTDIIMPEMNGRDLSRKIRSIYPLVKVLFMSGYTADIIASRGEVDEVMNLIRKPFTVKELTKKVYDTLHPLSDFRE